MVYEKPAVRVLGDASSVIQGRKLLIVESDGKTMPGVHPDALVD